MSSPTEIELVWGRGKWNKSKRQVLRPWIEAAVGIAESGLGFLGLETDRNIRMTVGLATAEINSEASADPLNRVVDIYIPNKDIKRKKMHRIFGGLALTTFHEIVHIVRADKYSEEDLVETAATEGLAYMAEYILASEILTPEETQDNFNDELMLSGVAEQRLIKDFARDSAVIDSLIDENGTVDIDDFDLASGILDRWFNPPGKSFPEGASLGFTAVSRLIGLGVGFSEVFQMPAEEIMRLSDGHDGC